MPQIRIKLDLSLEDVLRLSGAMDDNAHEYEKMARYFDEKEKPEYSKFYGILAERALMLKEALDLQIADTKNVYIGGCEDE